MLRVALWLVAGVFAWLAGSAAFELCRDAASVPWAERRRAVVEPEALRVARFVPRWQALHQAILEHVPADARVALLFHLDEGSFQEAQRLGVLLQPRRTVSIVRALAPGEIDAAARQAAASGRPVYVADLRSGFPLPPGLAPVAAGSGFDLWRLVR
jgi:hypothetical protein